MSWFGFGSSSSSEPVKPKAAPKPKIKKPTKALSERQRTDEGPTFASAKAPPGTGLENTCELPFGFVWTPMAASSNAKVIACDESLPPVICLNCLAYMNPHVTVNTLQKQWTCALCETANPLPSTKADWFQTATKEALVEYRQPLSRVSEQPEKHQSTIILVIDANLDKPQVDSILKALTHILPPSDDGTDQAPVRIGLVVFDQYVRFYQLGQTENCVADVYAPPSKQEEFTVQEEEEMMAQRQLQLDSQPYLATIASKEDLQSLEYCLDAIFAPAAKPASRKEVLQQQKQARLQKQESSTPPEVPNQSPFAAAAAKAVTTPRRCTGEAVHAAVDLATLSPDPTITSRVLLFTNGCPNMGDGTVVAPPPAEATKSSKKPSKQQVVDAEQLAKAVDFYDLTATVALETGVALDVFCSGALELALPAYQALVDPSGGYVLPHFTFTEKQLLHNLTYVLEHTYVSPDLAGLVDATQPPVESKARGLRRWFPKRKKEDDISQPACLVDIRCDSFMIPTHLVGPCELLPTTSAKLPLLERAAFHQAAENATKQGIKTNAFPSEQALSLSLTRMKLARVDPLSTLAVLAQVDASVEPEDKFAFFQITARWMDREAKTMITRVCTRRFPVASSVSDYVEHVDDETVSVLLAKGAVYRSLHGREETSNAKDKIVPGDSKTLEELAYQTQLDLDATVQRISGAFRLLGLEEKSDRKKGSTSSSLDFAFPPQLSEGLKRLYHLRRGALISPGPMGSMDDRADMRQLFLRLPLEDCVAMMAPQLWSTGDFEKTKPLLDTKIPIPAETLALWDTAIIAADQHVVQFVWSGKEVATSEFDEYRENFKNILAQKALNRFPLPEIHMLSDGDSMSRRFTTRLAPSHADSQDHQLANFPELSALSEEVLERLRGRFKFYDASSDASFRAWFWGVSSATNASREDGMSLCE
eukprot:Nitzschia sp. Nitz4//scaffold301_size22573//4197//6998//NITZ4_008550-RA/size22573-processed-gene-0.17-mRNA-1//1//CDS//3329547004//8789//frame0